MKTPNAPCTDCNYFQVGHLAIRLDDLADGIASIRADVSATRVKVEGIERAIPELVTQERFKPVERLVYGAVRLMLGILLAAVLAGVVAAPWYGSKIFSRAVAEQVQR